MDGELRQADSQDQPVTPDATEVQPEPKMVPEGDLRKMQGIKDREVAAAQQRAQAAEQQLAAMQASMNSQMADLARRTMGEDEATQFITQQQGQQQWTALQRQAAEGNKYRSIFRTAREYGVPISEFEEILSNPNAGPTDAQRVVMTFHQRELDALRKAQTTAEKEAATVQRQTQRQQRAGNGADAIGAPVEPTTGSPDLEAQYQKEKSQITSRALAGGQGMFQVLQTLKAKYRKLGLNV